MMIELMEILEKLKTTRRTGWIKHSVPDPESISDHMHRMSLLALTLPTNILIFNSDDITESKTIDVNKCVKMAIVHDIAESIVGDITPNCGVSKEDKYKLEMEAIDKICSLIEFNAEEVKSLFLEYETYQTPESIIVHDLDKLEMIYQAYNYETRYNIILDDFFMSTAGFFKTDYVRNLDSKLRVKREKRQDK